MNICSSYKWRIKCWLHRPQTTDTDTDTHRFNGYFSRWPLDFLHFFLDSTSSLDRPKLLIFPKTQPQWSILICLFPTNSITLQHFTQLASSLHSTCPNQLSLPFLMTKLTGLSSNNSLISTLLFLYFNLKAYIHLSTLAAVLSNLMSCSFSAKKILKIRQQLFDLSCWYINKQAKWLDHINKIIINMKYQTTT